MKNLIINIFKTLFFFDLAVIVISLLPVSQKNDPALSCLINEASVLAVTALFTFVFTLFVEKKKVRPPVGKHKIKSFFIGILAGAAIPLIFVAVLAVLKDFDYISFNKTKHYYYWLIALLCYSISTELLLRGYLFSLYKKYYGFTFAAAVTTLLYISLNIKLFSEDKYYIATIILFNILLCFLLYYTESVIATVTARFIYTLLSSFMLGSRLLWDGQPVFLNCVFAEKKYLTGTTHTLEGSALLLCITAFITLLIVLKMYKPFSEIKKLISKIKSNPKRHIKRKT